MRSPFLALVGLASLATTVVAQPPQRPVINGGLPSVSPDGKRVAFISNRSGTNDVFVIGADGSGVVQLTRSADYESEPRWTGDGRVVYSVFAQDTSRVFTVSVNGGDARQIAVVTSRSPVLANDGRSLLYSAGKFPALQLESGTLDGSNRKTLTDATAAVFNGVYSPDGSRVAYARMEPATRNMQVWIVNADGTGARQLTNFSEADGRPQWPAWSPDGRRVAVQAGKYNPQARAENTSHVWVIDVATRAATKLAAHDKPYLDETPSWFPDGRIAFQSDRSGQMEIWVMNADGTGARQLTR